MRRSLLALALTAFSAVGAQAATYVSTRTVGDVTAELSIVTNDKIGVLAAADIVDWTVKLTHGSTSTTLFGPGDDNSRLIFSGSALSATATQLLFNFDGPDNSYLDFQNEDGSDISTYRSTWLVQTSGAFTGFRQPEEVIRFGFISDPYIVRESRSGLQVIASVAGSTAPVPEPATWAMMLAGFGATGAALRRRRRPGRLRTA